MGKCPKCQQLLNSVTVRGIDGNDLIAGKTWKMASYECPFCFTVLSVQMDPLALKTETVADISAVLRK